MNTKQQGKIKKDVSFEVFDSLDIKVAEVLSAPMTEGTRTPSRFLKLDLGGLGERFSVGQYALIPEADLIGMKVVVCCNLGVRKIGKYTSEVLVLGVSHPDSPENQSQALPLRAPEHATCGDSIY